LYQRVEAFPLVSAERYDVSLYRRLFRDHDESPSYPELGIQRSAAESTTQGTSKHKAQAEAFLKWITGKGGQDILRTGTSFEYAVGIGAQSNPKLVPLADLQAPNIDPAKLNSKKVTELMIGAGLL
jgi:hypothetical protein